MIMPPLPTTSKLPKMLETLFYTESINTLRMMEEELMNKSTKILVLKLLLKV